MGVFQKLNDQGITIVMVTHELDMARLHQAHGRFCATATSSPTKTVARTALNAENELQQLRAGATGGQTRVMRIFASLKIAGRALRRNKMRSLLTMLGIIIGVGAVIGSVSLTTGATKQVEDQVASLGENVITVFSGNFTSGGMRGGWGSAPTLTVEDAKAIAQLPHVARRQPGSARPRANSRQRPELEHAGDGRIAGLSANPQPQHRQRRDVHRSGCAQPRQIRHHRQNRRGPVVSRRKSARTNHCASGTSRFRSSACSPRKASICSARTRMILSSFPTPATCTGSRRARL